MKRNKIFPGTNEKGFTLIEALIALAIFSIGILGVASMQITAIKSNTIARLQTESAALAVDRMERLHKLTYTDSDLDNGTHGPIKDGGYRITWNVSNGPVNETKMIQVVVTPLNPKGRPTVINFIKSQK